MRFGVGRVAGHEGRHLDHQVRRRLGLHQVLQQALAGHVERHARRRRPARRRPPRAAAARRRAQRRAAAGRPSAAWPMTDAVAVDEGRVAEGHLAEDRRRSSIGCLISVEVLEQRQALHHRVGLQRGIVAGLLVLEVRDRLASCRDLRRTTRSVWLASFWSARRLVVAVDAVQRLAGRRRARPAAATWTGRCRADASVLPWAICAAVRSAVPQLGRWRWSSASNTRQRRRSRAARRTGRRWPARR